MKIYDLTGQRFGNLTVIKRSERKTPHGDVLWDCICDCGNAKVAASYDLRYGKTSHCGCLTAAHISEKTKRNGHEPKVFYKMWQNMKTRCYNPNYKLYHRYCGRGITVCDEWLHDFSAFRTWCFAHNYSDGLTIDRIDNDKGYSPENCRFATVSEQANNRSTNRILTVHGEQLTIAQASKKYGVNQATLRAYCVKRGQNPDDVVRKFGGAS